MTRSMKLAFSLLVGLTLSTGIALSAPADKAEKPKGSHAEKPNPTNVKWAVPTPEDVRAEAFDWLESRNVNPAIRQQAEKIWNDLREPSTATERLSALAATFALADPRVDRLMQFCAQPRKGVQMPDADWLVEPNVEPLVSANLRLIAGRWLVQESLFDETLLQLGDLRPDQVVDPALLLFCRAVAHHRLLHKKEGLQAIDQLLLSEPDCPRRYAALTRLMREDLEGVAEETLDHIARRMEDVERRLDLGRAGPKVRGIEDGVIKSLDKMIKDLEDQQQCQNPGNSLQSNRPADDSQLMGGLGQGKVTHKKIGGKSGWGNLPPKKREEALQEIGRRFPSHYRDVIEQYFRKMATEETHREQ